MTFETRAARAARSLRSSIAGVTPGSGFPALVRRRRLATVAGLAAMTILVAGAMALAAILPFLGDETAGTSMPPTTIPTESPAVADTTTTTKPATTTTDAATDAAIGASSGTAGPRPPAGLTTKPPATTTTKPPATTTPPATTATTKPPATTTTKPPTTTTTAKPPATTTFTANQTYGYSDAEPHTEILSGTGVPGTKIELWSPYATTSVTVADDGTWQGTLTFTGAPPGDRKSVV